MDFLSGTKHKPWTT